jgi:hypothetical protein
MARAKARPFAHPDGLIEVPMGPIGDIDAVRIGCSRLDRFLKAVRLAVEWVIEDRGTIDFLGHPSCLDVTDPDFRAIDLVRKAGDRAAVLGLDGLAERTRVRKRES